MQENFDPNRSLDFTCPERRHQFNKTRREFVLGDVLSCPRGGHFLDYDTLEGAFQGFEYRLFVLWAEIREMGDK